MMLKVFDLLRSLGWYIVSFIYNLIDTLLAIIKKLNDNNEMYYCSPNGKIENVLKEKNIKFIPLNKKNILS